MTSGRVAIDKNKIKWNKNKNVFFVRKFEKVRIRLSGRQGPEDYSWKAVNAV